MAAYRERLERALARARDGDQKFVASPARRQLPQRLVRAARGPHPAVRSPAVRRDRRRPGLTGTNGIEHPTCRGRPERRGPAARQSEDVMFTRMSRAETAITPMPGRNWHSYIGPQTAPTTHLSMGVSVYEPGARPDGPRPRGRGGDRVLRLRPRQARLRRGPGRARGRRRGLHPGRDVPRHRVRRPGAARAACASSLRRSCPAPTRRRRVDPVVRAELSAREPLGLGSLDARDGNEENRKR